MLTNKKLRQMYDDFNARYFVGRLPENMILRFARQRDAGRCVVWLNRPWPWCITLRLELRRWPVVCRLTLLHEMAHAHCQVRGLEDHFDHGPAFIRERARLLRAGAFRDLANYAAEIGALHDQAEKAEAERGKLLEVIREYRKGCPHGYASRWPPDCPTCIKADALLPREGGSK